MYISYGEIFEYALSDPIRKKAYGSKVVLELMPPSSVRDTI
jgi:hypothetical protein